VDLTIRDQMLRDLTAFEKTLLVVVSAAGTDKDFVRRALFAITEDPDIPVELRRSQFIIDQFGDKPGRGARNAEEKRVFQTGKPEFLLRGQNFEMIYPLRANSVCMRCHVDAAGKPVPGGYVIGLAVKTVPASASHESSLMYFIMDLFWENLLMVGAILALCFAFIFYYFFKPLQKLNTEYDSLVLEHAEELDQGSFVRMDEMSRLKKTLAFLRSKAGL
jgi:hypothetical protein